MNNIIKLILIASVCMSAHSSEWVKTEGYMYRSDCDKPESIVFIYHGANKGSNISSPDELGDGNRLIINDLVSYCSLVVIPLADRHELRGLGSWQVWDFTDDFTHGLDSANQHVIIDLAQQYWPGVPTYLIGGSAGAFMAYKLANERRILGIPLDGLVMLDVASPYGVSADETHSRYKWTVFEFRYSVLGLDYYVSNVQHINLGFSNLYVEWNLDTLIVNSHNDRLVRDTEKMEFIRMLDRSSNNLQAYWEGENHDIGPSGVAIVREWLKERLLY